MKISKVVDKKVGDKKYHKYRITIPKKIIQDSDLLDKDLKITKRNGKIIIEPN